VTPKQGIRILFKEDARAVFRLSGTGTSGATLRVYLERFEPNPDRHDLPTAEVLAPVIEAANAIGEIVSRTGRNEPSVIT
jgi:phosphoglucomutase